MDVEVQGVDVSAGADDVNGQIPLPMALAERNHPSGIVVCLLVRI